MKACLLDVFPNAFESQKGEHTSCARLNQREQPFLEPSPRHIIEFAIARVNTCRDEPTRKSDQGHQKSARRRLRAGAPLLGGAVTDRMLGAVSEKPQP